jgi:hypothetical protein
VKLASALALAMSTIALGPISDSETPRVRKAANPIRRPIEQLIMPDDEVVILETSGLHIDRIGRPTVQQVVQNLRKEADLVVIAEVAGLTSHESASREWIDTDLSVYVHDFVFTSPQAKTLLNNRKQHFTIPGGEVLIGNVLVKTQGMFSLKVGGVYLLFLARAKDDASVMTWTYPPLLVAGAKLVSDRSEFHSNYFDPLSGQTVSKIVTLLKRP